MTARTILFLITGLCAAAAEVKLERVPEDGLQPQVVMDAGGMVHLVYLTGKPHASDIRYTRRSSAATAWEKPVTVNSIPHNAVATGTIRGAQIAVGRNGLVHVLWNGAALNNDHPNAPLCYSRLEDGKFQTQRTMNAGTIHLDGGASLAATNKGGVFIVWHASPPEGKVESDRRLFIRRSSDGGVTFTLPSPVNGAPAGVCACCSLKAFAGNDGSVLILYRDAVTPEQRDMKWLISKDGAAKFQLQDLHRWRIASCPMSSAAIVSGWPEPQAAWETDGIIHWSRLTSLPVIRAISPQNSRHPAMAINKHRETLVTWSIGTGWQRGGELGWAVLSPVATDKPATGRAPGVPVWSYPAAFANAAGDFIILH